MTAAEASSLEAPVFVPDFELPPAEAGPPLPHPAIMAAITAHAITPVDVRIERIRQG